MRRGVLHRCRSWLARLPPTRSSGTLMSGGGSGRPEVLGVPDVFAPLALGPLGWRLPDGQVGHELVRRRTVPVPLAGRRLDCVARPNLDDLAASRLDSAKAFGDVQGLAHRMGMPCVACPRREADDAHTHARGLLAAHDHVDPGVAREDVGRSLASGPKSLDFHLTSPTTGIAFDTDACEEPRQT